jgi:integrase/recombinase XerD
MRKTIRVRVRGPLVTHVSGYSAALSSQGYTDFSIANQLRLTAHLSRWMEQRAITATQITDCVVERFIVERRETHTMFRTSRALVPLLAYLRSVGALVEALPPSPPADPVLRAYAASLYERGLKPRRVRDYIAVAGQLLTGRSAAGLTAADVTAHVRMHADDPSLSERLTALRSALRFLFLRDDAPADLTYAVPSVTHRRLASLPKWLDQTEVSAMLATCDRRTTKGLRDHAALLLMVRIGLRACEVAALTLDDIDWQAGQITVFGKGASSILPLPRDVGDAMVSYLRRRYRRAGTRHVFLRARAPYQGGGAGMFTRLAAQALRAAGVSTGGSHRLRHTAATQMLRQGASLTEIAQVLRHRHIDTTAIYAKVARDDLQSVARPWPSALDNAASIDTLRTLAQPWSGGAA